jgi:Protein of unknown function (DUF2628)
MIPEPTENEIRAFVGKNSDYYLSRWSAFLTGEESKIRFNIAAFWLTGLWLPYRKMYKITIGIYAFIVTETILEYILFDEILKYEEPPKILDYIVGLTVGLVCGIYGNRWYYSHTCKNISEVRGLSTSEESRTQALIKRGGTSWSAAIGFILMFMILAIVVMGTVAVLFGKA